MNYDGICIFLIPVVLILVFGCGKSASVKNESVVAINVAYDDLAQSLENIKKPEDAKLFSEEMKRFRKRLNEISSKKTSKPLTAADMNEMSEAMDVGNAKVLAAFKSFAEKFDVPDEAVATVSEMFGPRSNDKFKQQIKELNEKRETN